VCWLNYAGLRTLMLCTGELTVTELQSHLRADYGIDIGDEALWRFLTDAERQHLIAFQTEPRTRKPRLHVTGHPEYYVPVHASIEITATCNLHCRHCYNAFSAEEDPLPWETLRCVLGSWAQMGLAGVELTGGEPLMHEEFLDILEFCTHKFSKVGVITNGTLIDRRFVDSVSNWANQLLFNVSLDGSTASRHDAIRGHGSFDRTVAAIRLLRAAGIWVRAGMTTATYNIDDLEATLELAASLGVNDFTATPVHAFGRGKQVAWGEVDEAQAVGYIYRALQRHPEVFHPIEIVFPELNDRLGNCGIGTKNIMVSPTGKLRACLYYAESEYVGDLRTQTLTEVFRSDAFRALATLRAPSPTTCAGCRYETFCHNCIAKAMTVLEKEKRLCRWAYSTSFLSAHSRFRRLRYEAVDPIFRGQSVGQSV